MSNLSFFEEFSLNISSNLEPAKAWSKTFNFLELHFPIEAISLHRFKPQYSSLHLEFLVLKEQFISLDTMVPILNHEVTEAPGPAPSNEIIHFSSSADGYVSSLIISHHQIYLSNSNDRALLIAVLETDDQVIGHLALIGKTANCFSAVHINKIKQIQPALCLALMNMHRYSQTEELKSRLYAERQQLVSEVRLLKESSIIGAKSGLRKTMKLIEQLIGKEAPVLILGETGTGKELIADAIQQISLRSNKPFIKVNCGAIPVSLIDSELFGHEKGAFTGALSNKIGRFEQADGGTLFLDEVGELPLQAQVRLLRVLQDGSFERVGGIKTIRVDVRIISATNRPLESMIKNGNFREDLFYRLNVFPIHIPPLRERQEDIPLLIRHFIKVNSKQLSLAHTIPISNRSIDKLRQYPWPGNVRELGNLVERAITIDSENVLDLALHLPQEIAEHPNREVINHDIMDLKNTSSDKVNNNKMLGMTDGELKTMMRQQVLSILAEKNLVDSDTQTTLNETKPQTLNEAMASHITKVLKQCNGKISGPNGAAEVLDIHHNTLRKRMAKLNISFGNNR